MSESTEGKTQVRLYLPVALKIAIEVEGALNQEKLSETVVRRLSEVYETPEPGRRRRSAQPA